MGKSWARNPLHGLRAVGYETRSVTRFQVIDTTLTDLLIFSHAVDHSADLSLSNSPLVTHSVDTCISFTAASLFVSMALFCTTSSESHCLDGPWLHHFIGTTLSRSGIVVPVNFSLGCCTRHSTPATKLIPIKFISFQILSLSNPFVAMSAMFDSVGTCFVANFSSIACCLQPQPLHLDVAALPCTQSLRHATTCHWVTEKYKCFRRLSSSVTIVFHQLTSRCSGSLCVELRLSQRQGSDFLRHRPPFQPVIPMHQRSSCC